MLYYFFLFATIISIIVASFLTLHIGLLLINMLIYLISSSIFEDPANTFGTLFFFNFMIILLASNSKNLHEEFPKKIFISYLLLILLSFIPAYFYSLSDVEMNLVKEINKNKEQNEYDDYLNKYDFDVKKINLNYSVGDSHFKDIKYPIIILNEGIFDFQINRNLAEWKKSYKWNEINTLIIINKKHKDVGGYNGIATRAIRVDKELSFIDRKSMVLMKNVIIKGGTPPITIKYLHSPPSLKYGDEVSIQTILNRIDSELTK